MLQVWLVGCCVLIEYVFVLVPCVLFAVAVDGSKYLVIRSLFVPGIDIIAAWWVCSAFSMDHVVGEPSDW